MVPLILGVFLIMLAIVGDRFTVGLKGRIQVPAWQGRTWLLLMGASLTVLGLAHLLHWSNTAAWQWVFDTIGNVYEVFAGGIVMFVGAMFALARKRKVSPQTRWIALAASVVGAIFLFDGLTKIMN